MRTCEGCNCQAYRLFTMPNGQDLCDYCSDSWVQVKNTKPVHKKRVYNNIKFSLKLKHGTISSWAKLHNFNPGTVSQVLNKSGYYNVTSIEVMSSTHLDILCALEQEGYAKLLVADGYVDN